MTARTLEERIAHTKVVRERERILAQEQRFKRYGLTRQQYEKMHADQGFACAICETPHDNPCIDHCHETGRVRGLLCDPCNLGLGAFRDHPERVLRAVTYLQRNKISK